MDEKGRQQGAAGSRLSLGCHAASASRAEDASSEVT